jgi:hypothetical protein
MQKFARDSEDGVRMEEEPPTQPRWIVESAVFDASPSIEIDESVDDGEAEAIYWARIGDGAQVPVLTRRIEEVLREPRDAGEGFVLAAIDGKSTVQELVRGCELPVLAVLHGLCELVERGVVSFASEGSPAPSSRLGAARTAPPRLR